MNASDVDPMIAAMMGDVKPLPEEEVAQLLKVAGIPDEAIERSAVAVVRQGLAQAIKATIKGGTRTHAPAPPTKAAADVAAELAPTPAAATPATDSPAELVETPPASPWASGARR